MQAFAYSDANKNTVRVLFKACTLLFVVGELTACSTSSVQPAAKHIELTRVEGRLGITQLQLGEHNEALSKAAETHYSATPRCETRRVAIAFTRKAFSLIICEYKPTSQMIQNNEVTRVVTYTLDDSLVRIDIDSSGNKQAFEKTLAAIEARWSAGQRRAIKASNREEIVWQAGSDELALSQQPVPGIIEYRIRDFGMAEKLPWLMQ